MVFNLGFHGFWCEYFVFVGFQFFFSFFYLLRRNKEEKNEKERGREGGRKGEREEGRVRVDLGG